MELEDIELRWLIKNGAEKVLQFRTYRKYMKIKGNTLSRVLEYSEWEDVTVVSEFELNVEPPAEEWEKIETDKSDGEYRTVAVEDVGNGEVRITDVKTEKSDNKSEEYIIDKNEDKNLIAAIKKRLGHDVSTEQAKKNLSVIEVLNNKYVYIDNIPLCVFFAPRYGCIRPEYLYLDINSPSEELVNSYRTLVYELQKRK